MNFKVSIMYNVLEVDRSSCTGTSYPAINSKDLAKIDIHYQQQAEQTKIGNYFQKLDKQIDLQQKELEKLKNIKKASLDKMFV